MPRVGVLDVAQTAGRAFDIGGPDVLAYVDMMRRVAAIEGRMLLIVPEPLLSPKLSSRRLLLVSLPRDAVRRRWVAWVCLVGAGLLGTSLSTKPGSPQFYGLTLGVAGTWIAGGLASGRLPRGGSAEPAPGRQVLVPVLLGVCAFGAFYGCALLAQRIPVLNQAITNVLRYDRQGSSRWVLFTTLVNGAAEEIFFRGAVYAAAAKQPVTRSTAVYALVTIATRNPALVLASVVMGTLFGLQRRATGGIQAPMITHLTWSTLMLRYLPPLFRCPSEPPLVRHP